MSTNRLPRVSRCTCQPAPSLPLDDLADLGIVRSRFWQHDYSNLMC